MPGLTDAEELSGGLQNQFALTLRDVHLYIVDFGGGEQERSCREAEREAESPAGRPLRALPRGQRRGKPGRSAQGHNSAVRSPRCRRQSVPVLLSSAAFRGAWRWLRLPVHLGRGPPRCRGGWLAGMVGAPAAELSAAHQREQDAIAAWLASQPGVDATRTSSYAPEQWEGIVDGRTFYFRERGGSWRVELNLAPSGKYARACSVGEDGTFVTEPVPIMGGEVIARGAESDLGAAPVDHIAFAVRTIRDHLRGVGCEHPGARLFCPDCGQRTGIGS